MKKISYTIFILQLIFFVFFLSCKNTQTSNPEQQTNIFVQNMDTITTRVFECETGGWGYEIIINGKPHIHQKIIPAISGRFTFNSSEDAYKIAVYAVEIMLRDNTSFPNMSFRELDSLGVLDTAVINYQKKHQITPKK